MSNFTLALTGDTIINKKLSVYDDDGFTSLVKILRDADVAFTHLETIIHDYDGPEVYPAAIAGGTWMRSPRFVADELKWMGFDIVSCPCNHSLDYSYGGLFSTMSALDQAGIVFAGIGKNLGQARAPAYVETKNGRLALISMSSSFPLWAAAGEARGDVKGRPGLNPLHYYHVVDAETMRMLEESASRIGLAVIRRGPVMLLNRPTVETLVQKFVIGDEIYQEADERDVIGNLQSVKEARSQADYVLVHLHTHEAHPGKGYQPAHFVKTFSKKCIDAGADVFIAQGAHRGMGGIELYNGKPIIYEPGDLINHSLTVTRLPMDFYLNSQWKDFGTNLDNPMSTPSEAFAARAKAQLYGKMKPEVEGSTAVVCEFEESRLKTMKMYPMVMSSGRAQGGRPMLASADQGKAIIEYLRSMSKPYGTEIRSEGNTGSIDL